MLFELSFQSTALGQILCRNQSNFLHNLGLIDKQVVFLETITTILSQIYVEITKNDSESLNH